MGSSWKYRWLLKSLTEDDKYYIVAVDEEGRYGCSCPGWKFNSRLKQEGCKHIRYLVDVFLKKAQKIDSKQYNKIKVLAYMCGVKAECETCKNGPRGMKCEHRFTNIFYEETKDKPVVVCNNCCIDFEIKAQE